MTNRPIGEYSEIYSYIINANLNLPKADINYIAYESYLKGLTKEQALEEAKKIFEY